MREAPVLLWRVDLDDESVFFILGCCLDEALQRAYDHIDDEDDVMSIAVAEGPLVIDDDDDEGEGDEVLPPITERKSKAKVVEGRN